MAYWFDAEKGYGGRKWVGFVRRDGVTKYLPHFHGRPEMSAGTMRGDGWEDLPDEEALEMAAYIGWGIDLANSFKVGS